MKTIGQLLCAHHKTPSTLADTIPKTPGHEMAGTLEALRGPEGNPSVSWPGGLCGLVWGKMGIGNRGGEEDGREAQDPRCP